jgi:glucose-1-phosphate thymidylyltransferase
LPCSKELYPVGFRAIDDDPPPRNRRPKAVCHHILEKMQLAGVEKTFIVLRSGKWDIPAYLGDGTILGEGPCRRHSASRSRNPMHLAYLMMRLPYGAPYTLDQAYPFVQDALIVFGFPDILFEPQDAFVQLIDHQATSSADVVLGLFPSDQPYKMDMVELEEGGAVRNIVIKPPESDLRYTWIIAVWTPAFTRYMHDYLAATLARADAGRADVRRLANGPELYVGDVIQAAINDDLRVEAVRFAEGLYLDIGTPSDLQRAVHQGGQLR